MSKKKLIELAVGQQAHERVLAYKNFEIRVGIKTISSLLLGIRNIPIRQT